MTGTAAFFRVEGTLTPRPTLTSAAWLAGNAQYVGERLARLGNVALAAPFVLGGPLRDPTVGARMAWMGLRGISEDRLVVLGEEYAVRWVIPSLRAVGVELLERARSRGHRVVLISDNLDVVVRPVAEHLGVADVVCNRMEITEKRVGNRVRRAASGSLLEPVIGGNVAVGWVRRFADENGIDLSASLAYGAQEDDSLLLSTIGRPCAVHPDRGLRRTARDLDWPVVEER